MPRTCRVAPDGYPFHVINRGNRRQTIFPENIDREAFLTWMAHAADQIAMRVLAYILMDNHFHLVLWPYEGVALSEYMRVLTGGYACHHHAIHEMKGLGHLFQGRFKSFVIQHDVHLMNVIRYVEANAVRARCVTSAADWRWSSITRRFAADGRSLLSPSPIARPANWLDIVNAEIPSEELVNLRLSVRRERPYGDDGWVSSMVDTYKLSHTIRPPGRPPHALHSLSASV